MAMTCNYCGNTKKFYATQVVSGTITVIVDANNNFLEDQDGGQDGNIDTSSLNYDDPEGPYECVECNSTDIDGVED